MTTTSDVAGRQAVSAADLRRSLRRSSPRYGERAVEAVLLVAAALSLLTTVGFVDVPPRSVSGQLVAAALMSLGFLLLSLVSAALASLFVRDDEQPSETEQHVVGQQVLQQLQVLTDRVQALELLLARDAAQDSQGATPTTPVQAAAEA